jgi:hypothetical protein
VNVNYDMFDLPSCEIQASIADAIDVDCTQLVDCSLDPFDCASDIDLADDVAVGAVDATADAKHSVCQILHRQKTECEKSEKLKLNKTVNFHQIDNCASNLTSIYFNPCNLLPCKLKINKNRRMITNKSSP